MASLDENTWEYFEIKTLIWGQVLSAAPTCAQSNMLLDRRNTFAVLVLNDLRCLFMTSTFHCILHEIEITTYRSEDPSPGKVSRKILRRKL